MKKSPFAKEIDKSACVVSDCLLLLDGKKETGGDHDAIRQQKIHRCLLYFILRCVKGTLHVLKFELCNKEVDTELGDFQGAANMMDVNLTNEGEYYDGVKAVFKIDVKKVGVRFSFRKVMTAYNLETELKLFSQDVAKLAGQHHSLIFFSQLAENRFEIDTFLSRILRVYLNYGSAGCIALLSSIFLPLKYFHCDTNMVHTA
ncbi:hypothetical protein NQ317_017755 [Molorchus minor]|uniref:Uncharacterized protein n=1 Tax=Molorchus minor TaxID=1323400 RepID=A0ABQ9JGK4_9CUCU|nr:hypothetical protein NQ317_017755 [Molorchus minor]